jgi:hypothetical protein
MRTYQRGAPPNRETQAADGSPGNAGRSLIDADAWLIDFQARAAYSAFRQIACTVATSRSGQAALKLDEYTLAHREAFVRAAEAALTTAQGEPYATLLSAATFDPERVTATLATLDALTAAATAQEAAQHRAKQATAARDAAMRQLATVARQIKVEVKTARPEGRVATRVGSALCFIGACCVPEQWSRRLARPRCGRSVTGHSR